MKRFHANVAISNGSFERTFAVRVSATNWHMASKAATKLAINALKLHLKAMGGKRERFNISSIAFSMNRPVTLEPGETPSDRSYFLHVGGLRNGTH